MKRVYRSVIGLLLGTLLLACGQANTDKSQPAFDSITSTKDMTQKLSPQTAHDSSTAELTQASDFFNIVMNAQPILPRDLSSSSLSCGNINNAPTPQRFFRPETQTNYTAPHWDTRITRNWEFFDIEKEDGKVLVIDYKQARGKLGYRYLANQSTQNDIYEPWSSAKLHAITAAIAKVRKSHPALKANAKIGDTSIADMISSIHSYQTIGNANTNSNALATFFTNLAGRDYLTSLFFDEWLKLPEQQVFFRGSFGPDSFVPANNIWANIKDAQSSRVSFFSNAKEDPGYVFYSCEKCATTGNKPMSTLVQAEWLKRLMTHDRSEQTKHPELTTSDIELLLYGSSTDANNTNVGGMISGISNMLQIAIANAMSNTDSALVKTTPEQAKRILDQNTQGKWRVFQKVGWGVSETRSASEHVVLAHVCLPHYQGGREFTVSAQTALPIGLVEPNTKNENENEPIALTGIKMQQNLNKAMKRLLNHPSSL